MIAAILMFALMQLVRGEEVFKMIGTKDCRVTLTIVRLDLDVSSVVTNADSLFVDQFVYSNATMSTSGDCAGIRVYDNALGETPVSVYPVLHPTNPMDCDSKNQRYYKFDIWEDNHSVQAWKLYYICPPKTDH